MRYALISDVHANLPALDAVLVHIAEHAPDTPIYHLGDLVGYAPWPNEVVAKLRDWSIPGVAGNYDSTVATNYAHCGCKYEDARQEELSHASFAWTLEHTTEATRRWLGRLPFRIDLRPLGGHASGPTVVLLHGNHVLNTVYVHEERTDDFLARMGGAVGAKSGDVVCFGHTHRPWHRVVGGVHYVNTGSVGRPKDGDPRACYVSLDVTTPDTIAVEFVRVAYDVELAAAAIVAAGLPRELGDHLRSGGTMRVPADT